MDLEITVGKINDWPIESNYSLIGKCLYTLTEYFIQVLTDHSQNVSAPRSSKAGLSQGPDFKKESMKWNSSNLHKHDKSSLFSSDSVDYRSWDFSKLATFFVNVEGILQIFIKGVHTPNDIQNLKNVIKEIVKTRNEWAHQRSISFDDTYRFLDNVERVVRSFGLLRPAKSLSTLKYTYFVVNFQRSYAKIEELTDTTKIFNCINRKHEEELLELEQQELREQQERELREQQIAQEKEQKRIKELERVTQENKLREEEGRVRQHQLYLKEQQKVQAELQRQQQLQIKEQKRLLAEAQKKIQDQQKQLKQQSKSLIVPPVSLKSLKSKASSSSPLEVINLVESDDDMMTDSNPTRSNINGNTKAITTTTTTTNSNGNGFSKNKNIIPGLVNGNGRSREYYIENPLQIARAEKRPLEEEENDGMDVDMEEAKTKYTKASAEEPLPTSSIFSMPIPKSVPTLPNPVGFQFPTNQNSFMNNNNALKSTVIDHNISWADKISQSIAMGSQTNPINLDSFKEMAMGYTAPPSNNSHINPQNNKLQTQNKKKKSKKKKKSDFTEIRPNSLLR